MGFEPGMKVFKLSMSSFLSGDKGLFIFGARETKYLLNSSAIIRCSIVRPLIIMNEGFVDSLFFVWLLTFSKIFFWTETFFS